MREVRCLHMWLLRYTRGVVSWTTMSPIPETHVHTVTPDKTDSLATNNTPPKATQILNRNRVCGSGC